MNEDSFMCLLKQILIELKELNNRVTQRANTTGYIEVDTSKTDKKVFPATDILGIKANHLAVLDIGGGFTIAINGEKEITASNDYIVEDEDIVSISVTGNGVAGTGLIRISGYIQKYKNGV